MSDRDFGRYNCTARNNIGMRYQEFILAQAGEFATDNHICGLFWISKMCGVRVPTPFDSGLAQ